MRILAFGFGSPGACRPLERALIRLGHEVFIENDCAIAVNCIGEMEIRVAIADGRLPKFDWIELCRRLRSDSGRPYVHIILLEGPAADDSHEIWAVEAGVDDFLDKLADETELRRRLRLAASRVSDAGPLREAENLGAE
jgi:DNA-binding response OmpR family regulator